ncbi:MAG: hypothetical protein ACTHW3_00865 [Leucobacter sp.]
MNYSSPSSRVRGAGAAVAVVAFLGTAVAAPFSVAAASVDGGSAMAVQSRTHQEFIPEDFALVMDVSVSETGEDTQAANGDDAGGSSPSSESLYSLEEFLFSGVVNWGGHKFTFYSQQVLPGPGLQIPGRHVNKGGYVSDEDGYIVLAGSAPKGTVFETPFGRQGKIYDRGTVGNHLDVYIR